ncbi:hypothetical protein GCM10018777_45950 [Streptomyces albogriseolus]|nr:hypothetical protein GCM10018777_45950 [Streptomyces viridodiastaticus]
MRTSNQSEEDYAVRPPIVRPDAGRSSARTPTARTAASGPGRRTAGCAEGRFAYLLAKASRSRISLNWFPS